MCSSDLSLIRITGFIEQGYKLAADDGSRRIILRTGKGLLVADAETYHAWIAQIHAVDVVGAELRPSASSSASRPCWQGLRKAKLAHLSRGGRLVISSC